MVKFIRKPAEIECLVETQETSRFIVDEPQTYKVVGYSVNPNPGTGRLSFSIGLSHNEPLDVSDYMNLLCH